MVSIEQFYKFKVEYKYTDIILRINDSHDISLHKIIICEKSPYIRKHLEYNPNNIINISLPDDTTIESFDIATDFIYGNFVTTDNVTSVINTFYFLGVDKIYILDYMYKVLPIKDLLTDNHKKALVKVEDDNLLTFYGNELLDYVEFGDDQIIFGKDMSNEFLLSYFKIREDNNTNMENFEWHHFNNLHPDDEFIKFEAVGHKWSIGRNIWGREETYDEILLALRADTTAIFRIVLILFVEGMAPKKKYFYYDCSDDNDLKALRTKHYNIDKCGINIYNNECSERVRASVFLQKL